MCQRKWVICTLVLVIFLVSTITGCKSSPTPVEQITLQLNWYHAPEFVGYYMAETKGYYRDSFLDVEINEGGPGINAREYILDGRADFAITSFSEQITLLKENKPSVAVMTTFQIPPLVMFALKDSGIKEPKDMIGKKIGIKNDYWREISRQTLTNAGIDPSQVIEVDVPVDAQNMLYNRQVDVWMGYAHDEPISAEVAGYEVVNIYPAEYGVGGYESLLITNQETIERKSDTVRRFVRASQKGLQYALEHPDEAAQIMTKWQSKENLSFYKLAIRAIIPMVDVPQSEIGMVDPARWALLTAPFYDVQNTGYTMQFLQED